MISLVALGSSVLNTALYLSVALALTGAFLKFYVWFTPYDEFQMIREGNLAAALSVSGTLIGFVLPLASVIIHSSKIEYLLLWSLIGLVVQSLVFYIVDFTLAHMNVMMSEKNVAAGTFLGASSLSAGILTAACLVP